jgi:MFS family permease
MSEKATLSSAWALLAVLWLTFLLAYTDRQAIFSIFPLLRAELTFSQAQLGLTGSLFLWVYSLCSPFGGTLGDRFPRAVVIQWSVVLWSFTVLATGFVNSPGWVLALRATLGATQCAFVPTALAAIASAHPDSTKSKALALFGTAQLAGIVFGGWYGGFVAERLNWRWVFLLAGSAGVLYGVGLKPVLDRLLPSNKRAEPRGASDQSPSRSRTNPLTLFAIPTFSLFSVAFFVLCAMLWMIYTWLPSFFTEKFGLSLPQAGLTATLSVQVSTAVGLLLGGIIADKLVLRLKSGRAWLLIVGMLGAAPCLHFLAYAPTLGITKVAASCFGLFTGLYIANGMASMMDVVRRNLHATGVGAFNMVGGISGGLIAYLVGQLRGKYGIEVLMSAVAVSGLLAVIVLGISTVIFFPSDYKKAHETG